MREMNWELVESNDTHSFWKTYAYGIVRFGFGIGKNLPAHEGVITTLDAAKNKAAGIVSNRSPFGGIEMFQLGR